MRTEANNHSRNLYGNNQAVYKLLRCGVPVKTEAGKITETVHLIDWLDAGNNDFVIVEEVTLLGNHQRRIDLVLYVNGIAVAVLELKNSRVSIGDGIRRSLSNQQPEFNEWFFSTVQFVFAGNDSEGLRYGSIGTEEKYFLTWKEGEQDNSRFKLDKYLLKLCSKRRLIELMYDFVLFDGGIKKLPRVHQYFGIKAAQEFVKAYLGGIIWHTQGSGKSIVMVLLAKWILENNPNARVAIVTDRDELDKQIERVFTEAGETIYRTSSGHDLMSQLAQAKPRLLCSLVHKFGRRDVDDFDAFIKDLENQPSQTVGEVFVFVDECHRTQSGKLHRVMKAMMPNAVFIGFTGTPLLKKDKATSLEVFGGYIHTYKFNEAVEDRVILDLLYEARDINQRLTSQESVDEWFEIVSKDLNDWQNLNVREIVRKASAETLDMKAYEADMRHLIDTYIEADEPRKISPFDNLGLLELIVKTGIAEAIATKLGNMKNKESVAETIENNVRSKIIKEHLSDPAYFEKMSALLDEIIAARKAKAIEYEEYLKRIAELAKKVEAGHSDETPAKLDTPGKRALYNNLKQQSGKHQGSAETQGGYTAPGDPVLDLALMIDATVKQVRPDGWRGIQSREQVIKAALYGVLQDVGEVEKIFLIIKAQGEY